MNNEKPVNEAEKHGSGANTLHSSAAAELGVNLAPTTGNPWVHPSDWS